MTYKTFDELNGKTLTPDDSVITFWGEAKVVNGSDLVFMDESAHYALASEVDVHSTCKKAYGYDPVYNHVCYPMARKGDYEALTRLCLLLLALQEGAAGVWFLNDDGTWREAMVYEFDDKNSFVIPCTLTKEHTDALIGVDKSSPEYWVKHLGEKVRGRDTHGTLYSIGIEGALILGMKRKVLCPISELEHYTETPIDIAYDRIEWGGEDIRKILQELYDSK